MVSCLDENLNQPDITYNDFLDVLNYAETHGDFINSTENPALISVDEVYAGLTSFLIVDIRNPSEFVLGHIPGAINVSPQEVINFLDTMHVLKFEKVIIVSASGQKAGYITSLLRILGYVNIYSLDYGMGYWNEIFSDIWRSSKSNSKYINNFYLLRIPYRDKIKISYSTPPLSFEDETKPIIQKLKERARLLITNYEINSVITVEQFDEMLNVNTIQVGFGKTRFIICYDHELKRGANPKEPLLYNAHKVIPLSVYKDGKLIRYDTTKSPPVRPPEANLYNGQFPEYDFSSDRLLFTIPAHKEIIIYSYNGQRSAYITAYLNLLGYNAKFVKFGAHSLMSKYFISWKIIGAVEKNYLDTVYFPSEFSKYDFYDENIRNYPFEVGGE